MQRFCELIHRCFLNSQAAFAKAEAKLQQERATLTRFENELKELEGVIKEKKSAAREAALKFDALEHDIQTHIKEKAAATNSVAHLEKKHAWITEEHE